MLPCLPSGKRRAVHIRSAGGRQRALFSSPRPVELCDLPISIQPLRRHVAIQRGHCGATLHVPCRSPISPANSGSAATLIGSARTAKLRLSHRLASIFFKHFRATATRVARFQ